MRTWLPLTPRTVTVTSLPIITVSPTLLVNINILGLLTYQAVGAGQDVAVETALPPALVSNTSGGRNRHGISNHSRKNTRNATAILASSMHE
jgi:hypothetical protein